jgi:hypothetical protein
MQHGWDEWDGRLKVRRVYSVSCSRQGEVCSLWFHVRGLCCRINIIWTSWFSRYLLRIQTAFVVHFKYHGNYKFAETYYL